MRRNRASMRKERIIMLASSVFVLTALTMTGFYVKEKNDSEKDGYMVDMSALEKRTEDKTKELAETSAKEKEGSTKGKEGSAKEKEAADEFSAEIANDLDYDPYFQEASSSDVENLWDSIRKESQETDEITTDAAKESNAVANSEAAKADVTERTDGSAKTDVTASANVNSAINEMAKSESVIKDTAKAAVFQEKGKLDWPVAGNVLINYSMDKTVYFKTLEQYKFSPAIVISAAEGENITASADGKVKEVFENAEIGHAVTVDIGNGYEITYGQLRDINVLKGDLVSAGDILGKVSAPTKYYSKEGANLYFKLTKDGTPINPLSNLG